MDTKLNHKDVKSLARLPTPKKADAIVISEIVRKIIHPLASSNPPQSECADEQFNGMHASCATEHLDSK